MSDIVFLDTETTGLDPAKEQVFEVAVVRPDGKHKVWTFEPHPLTVRNMHPKALEVTRYKERTSHRDWTWTAGLNDGYSVWRKAMEDLSTWLTGKHIVGAVPDFDARHLTSMYREFNLDVPKWHYHLIDVEVVAVGYIKSVAKRSRAFGLKQEVKELEALIKPPYKSDELAEYFGVTIHDNDRHTALGDALWVKRWWESL